MDTETSVKVAVRVRPQNAREQIDMCCVCTFCTPDSPHIVLGKDKAFTYDYVFDTGAQQEEIYQSCVEELIAGCLEGYNATILAYGQTGSGKTYSMGTGFGMALSPEEEGVIPRAVAQIFSSIEEQKMQALERGGPQPEVTVTVQFLELYNEEIIDLCGEQGRRLRIHEDQFSNIYVAGATEQRVDSQQETLSCLKHGALSRTVGSTNMNAQSSRSHAIFTLHISHRRPCKPSSEGEAMDWEELSSKLHFVDLAGSERLKRTGATGDRAKEGISINCGLLALGNVISALGDKTKKSSHVPYRDSKLTRLLQDSLGGNSKTLMVACVSPTDRDFMETLNTLKYSNRARNIKNKVTLNQDKASLQLANLRSRISELEVELTEFKSGRTIVSEDGSVVVNDMATEITMLRTENDKLRIRVKGSQQVIDSQGTKIASLLTEREMTSLGRADESTGQVVGSHGDKNKDGLSSVIQGYMEQIEELKSRLVLSESLAAQSPRSPFRRAPSTLARGASRGALTRGASHDIEGLLSVARSDIQRLREQEETKENGGHVSSEEDSSGSEIDSDGGGGLSDDSESDGEESLASTIAELSSEINLKQQLVDQLERSQKNFAQMRNQYEEKMTVLQTQIRSVEVERDKVLKEIGSQRGGELSQAKVKEVKASYEKQLKDLKSELKQLKTVKREHARAMKKNAEQDRQLKLLNGQLLDMKKQKVKMINKMRQEANVKKVDDSRKAKEMGQLRKEARRREHQIQSLESNAKRREAVLKRRQEEVSALRRKNRVASSSTATSLSSSGVSSLLTSSTASTLSSSGVSSLLTSSTASTLSSSGGASGGGLDGVAVLSSSSTDTSYKSTVVLREKTGRSVDKVKRRMSSVFTSDSARKKWRNFERKIVDAILKRQTVTNISVDMDNWIEKRDRISRNLESFRTQKKSVLASKMVDVAELASIEEDLDSATANIDYVQENIVELQNDLIALDDSKVDGDTMEAQSIINACSPREAKYLLEHLLDVALNLGVKAGQRETEVKSLSARLKASEVSAEIMQSLSSPQVSSQLKVTKFKGYRRAPSSPPVMDLEELDDPPKASKSLTSLTGPEKQTTKLRRRTALPTEILSTMSDKRNPTSKGAGNSTDGSEESVSEVRVRHGSAGPFDAKKKGLKKKPAERADTCSSIDVASCPPSSPASSPRGGLKTSSSETNVWARLAHTLPSQSIDAKGSLQVERPDSKRSSTQRLLTCTHTANGHTSAVLSMFATQSYLFSASQDRSVKVWNLKTGTELLSLDKHFSYVRSVTFCPRTSLIFTASQSLIKIWDMRHHRARCIKTFGPPSGSGESVVQDLLVSPCGNILFSAAGNVINIWDLRKFMFCGRLVGHNGAVCALSLSNGIMATGARDRLIKLFDLSSLDLSTPSPVSQPSMCTLYPPHYDAVSAFGVHGNLLFSACGVTIKQWDLSERSLKHAVDGAHPQGNLINSLGVLPSPLSPLLVSGCKGGLLKLWQPDSCSSIGEVVAHRSSINSIATNDTCIFTGSSDKTVKIWRPCLQD
ncbi:kinesin-like protein KIF21A [Halichondria panicea]|uniref:kinesin-like protein KIF21A n=1 Tax=Halichondria panicea TaxID=6063 RepID=UPI00312B56A2